MGKKSGGSTTTTYTPSAEERALQNEELQYIRQVKPNAFKLNDVAGNLLYNSLGDTKVDYNQLMNDAINQVKWPATFHQIIKRRWKTALRAAYKTAWVIYSVI